MTKKVFKKKNPDFLHSKLINSNEITSSVK